MGKSFDMEILLKKEAAFKDSNLIAIKRVDEPSFASPFAKRIKILTITSRLNIAGSSRAEDITQI